MRLFATIKKRLRSEVVARMILESDKFTPKERALLERASVAPRRSSMSDDFRAAEQPKRQVEALRSVFNLRRDPDLSDVDALLDLLSACCAKIKADRTALDFKKDRLNRQQRKKAKLGKFGKRAYNRRFRLLRAFNKKLATYQTQLGICDALVVAKSGLATRLTAQAFRQSEAAGHFIAYRVALLNRRSVFSNVGQDKAFDEVAAMLLDRVDGGWFAVAHAFPDRRVLEKLNARQKTALMLLALDELRKLAVMLKKAWIGTQFDRAKMIVQRGDDSSTWNALAGAWNQVRRSYFSMLAAMDAGEMVADVCPGKVMRLMAADVAAWHRVSGGDVDPNTGIWANLPPPWEVLDGTALCSSADVEKACRVRGVDPYSSGWLPTLSEARAVPFKPTPELVHGVAVSTPDLAVVIRRAGWFSGKSATPVAGVDVERDEMGFATKAKDGV